MDTEYFLRQKKISSMKSLGYSTIPSIHFDTINIYGENHALAAEWLTSAIQNSSKADEILKRMECEKLFSVIVSCE